MSRFWTDASSRSLAIMCKHDVIQETGNAWRIATQPEFEHMVSEIRVQTQRDTHDHHNIFLRYRGVNVD